MRYIILISLFSLLACGGEESKEIDINKRDQEQIVNYVDTVTLQRIDFKSELISNGRLRASKKSDLSFKGTGYVDVLNYNNGDYVQAGSVIASLNCEDDKIRVDEARNQLAKAELDYQDALLGFGYSIKDTSIIPAETRYIARVKSGYNSAKTNLEGAKNGLNGRVIKAPFGGKIANLKTKNHENPKGDFFCSVVDDSGFDVEFPVMESEVSKIKEGMEVSVGTFSEPSVRYRGRIKSLNPTVDDKGQVLVLATVGNSSGKLMDGMNVKVFVESRIPRRLVVPKSAVLIRDNKDVLFTFGEDGKAHWTYVLIEASNSKEYSVVANTDRGAELIEGAAVIVSGNLNLADGSDVKVGIKGSK